MSRTSKRYLKQKADEKQTKTYYRAGIYTRLSNERSESWREKSSSIETQVLNCKEYALKENIEVVEVFTDYEYSGTNFERPAFIEMMDAVKERKINCIIIRDLSRLGREHLEMGRLIDKVFPFLGVRFISVSDKVDTVKDADSKKSFEITLKNIVNDMYAKDISSKIKTTKINRAKNGYYIGSFAPYGYKINSTKNGQKLIVDENVSFIVEEMFDLIYKGETQVDVAKIFNEKLYSTITTYRKTGRVYRNDDEPKWSNAVISKMLRNKVYLGFLVQGVSQQNLAKGERQRRVSEEEYIIYEDAHKPIISEEKFAYISNNILKTNKAKERVEYINDVKIDYEDRYRGLIIDNNTGKKLYRKVRLYGKDKEKFYYKYQTSINMLDDKAVKSVSIIEKNLDTALVKKISELLKQIGRKDVLIKRISTRFDKASDKLDKDIARLSKKLEKEELSIQKSYEKYSLGKLDRDNYKLKKDIHNNHIILINEEIQILETKHKNYLIEKKKAIKWIDNLFKAQGIQKLPSELIHELIEEVLVYGTHNFEIFFKFTLNEIKEAKYE